MTSRARHAHYDADVPPSLEPYATETLLDMVRSRTGERPDAAAIRFEGRVTTYRDLVRDAEAFGQALEMLGVVRGDRVALILPNTPQFVVAELGAWMAGAIVAAIANPARGTKKIGSVGMPLPDVDLRIVDPEAGEREMPQGEQGEVLVSGRQLMLGYWEQPAESAEVLQRASDGRQWLRTGDIGYLDADGYLFLTDRKIELIKVSGFQVWPREVEEVLATHLAVAESGVAAVPHPRRGEIPKAWVVLRPGTTASPDEIRGFCRERLASYKVPGEVRIVDSLPKSAIGKVLRRKLKELDAAG